MCSSNHRIIKIDIIRIAGAFWIAGFWHLMGYTKNIVFNDPVTLAVTRIFLTSYVFISGLLAGRKGELSNREKIVDFYLRRFTHVYIPFCFACLLSLLERYVWGTWLFKDWNVFWTTFGGYPA